MFFLSHRSRLLGLCSRAPLSGLLWLPGPRNKKAEDRSMYLGFGLGELGAAQRHVISYRKWLVVVGPRKATRVTLPGLPGVACPLRFRYLLDCVVSLDCGGKQEAVMLCNRYGSLLL